MEKQKNIPQLRFPDFEEEWETKKIDKIFHISAGGDISKENVSYTKTDIYKYPIYANAEKNKGFYAYSNIYKIDKDVVTIAGRGVNMGIAHARREKFYPIVRLLILEPKTKSSVVFWEFAINKLNFYVESTGVPQLTAPQISTYKISFPTLPEQQRIASFFTAIDQKISQLKLKKTLLEQYKKGVMQKIFSQQIRFKGDNGQEFPKWEKIELGELLLHKAIRNKESKITLVLSVSNTRGFITQSEQFDNHRVASADVSNYKIVNKDDFAYNPSRINVGSIARLTDYNEGIVSPMYVVFGLRKSLNAIFFENWIDTHKFKFLVKTSCSGSVRDSLNFEDMCYFNIKLPSLPEQTKITNFLSAIDDKITHTKKQIELAEIWKKGLMQQMFV